MANVANIKFGEDVNTNGISVSVYFSGCNFNCRNCFNKEFQDFNYGVNFTNDIQNYIFDFVEKNIEFIDNLAILGGEPLNQENYNSVLELCKSFKLKFPDKKIWVWTGNLFDNIKNLEIVSVADYIIDGLFLEEFKDKNLKYRGSSNQRIFKNGNLILDKSLIV